MFCQSQELQTGLVHLIIIFSLKEKKVIYNIVRLHHIMML